MRKPRRLTRREEQAVRRAIARGATRREAAKAAGISVTLLYQALREQLVDVPPGKRGPRPGREYPSHPEFVEIPLEEIYRRAAELRETRWTEEERATRWNPRFSPPESG